MNKLPTALILLVAGLLTAGSVSAATAKPSEAQMRYKQDRAKCMRGETNQDRATCLKEAGAALQESKNLGTSADEDLARNRLKRCDGLPGTQRAECNARMADGSTSGSAQQGGILRENTVPTK